MRLALMLGVMAGLGAAQAAAQESFALSGLVQGCTAEGEGAGCTFYAEDARWVAFAGGGTPDAVLAAVAALPLNAPARFTGEIVGMGDITVEVVLTAVEAGGEDHHAALRAGLQGDWVSVEDPLAALRITGSEWSNIYDGQEMGQNLMTLGGSCGEGIETDGPAVVLQMFGGAPQDQTCLGVTEISADSLTLIHLPRGNLLAYRRP